MSLSVSKSIELKESLFNSSKIFYCLFKKNSAFNDNLIGRYRLTIERALTCVILVDVHY